MNRSARSRERPASSTVPDNVRRLPGVPSDADLVELEGETLALAMYDRFAVDVNRVVGSLLGPDPDHDDLVQKVFATALAKLHDLRDRSHLKEWLVAIAANTTRTELRRRQRWRWLSLGGDNHDRGQVVEDHDARALLSEFYEVVDKLPTDERIAFIFRYVDDRPLTEIAALCGCSLATIKRRLSRASERFLGLAKHRPDLMARIERGARWRQPS